MTFSELHSVIPLHSKHLLYFAFKLKKKQFVNYILDGEILKLPY